MQYAGKFLRQINGLVGNEAALQIQGKMIKNVSLSSDNKFAAMIGVVTLLFGASGVFAEIQYSINHIWGLKAKPKKGLVKLIINRLMSFSMIGSMGFLLLVGLIVNSVMDVLNARLLAILPQVTIYLIYAVNWSLF